MLLIIFTACTNDKRDGELLLRRLLPEGYCIIISLRKYVLNNFRIMSTMGKTYCDEETALLWTLFMIKFVF